MFCFLNYRSSPVSLLLLISIFGLSRSHHFEPRYRFHICSTPGNITTNSNLGSDLIGILGSLSEASSDSFYNRTFNGMYGLVLCRGDVPNDYCHSCVSTASREVRDRCPLRVNATIWYDECMLRYSDKNFLGTVEISPRFLMGDSGNQTSPDDSNIDGSALLSQIASEASVLPMMYKANKLHGTGYGLVQCTRDLNSSACYKCLMALLEEIGQVYKGRVGWRILSPSCSITYEKYLFYSQSASPQGLSAKMIAVIIISTVAAVAFLASLLYCLLLVGDCSLSEALRWIQIGLLCVQEDPNIRPTMSMVVLMLGSKSIPLPQPSKPPFFPIGFPASTGQSSTTLLGTGYLSTQSSTTASI